MNYMPGVRASNCNTGMACVILVCILCMYFQYVDLYILRAMLPMMFDVTFFYQVNV